MRHSYIDEYSLINGFIQGLDPRIKIISFVVFILAIIFTSPESFLAFAWYGLLTVVLIFISSIPPWYILKKSLAIIPLVFLIAIFIPFLKSGRIIAEYQIGNFKVSLTYEGLMIFWNCLIKAYLSILSMILLVTTTKFPDFLKAIEKLGFPSVLIMVISFMYRYIFVVTDELMVMRQAKESRSVRKAGFSNIKIFSNMLGVLFVRAYERAENVYLAMCSRGFDGKVQTLHEFRLGVKDFCFLLSMVSLLVAIKIFGVKNG